jgi:CheY-like chemotaxis protein
MSRLLESFGLEVQEAHTIANAIECLASSPQYLVLDWLMHGADSTAVINHARRTAPRTRIVVVTVAHDRYDEIRLLSPDAIFTKPFSPAVLQEWFVQNGANLASDSKSN